MNKLIKSFLIAAMLLVPSVSFAQTATPAACATEEIMTPRIIEAMPDAIVIDHITETGTVFVIFRAESQGDTVLALGFDVITGCATGEYTVLTFQQYFDITGKRLT